VQTAGETNRAVLPELPCAEPGDRIVHFTYRQATFLVCGLAYLPFGLCVLFRTLGDAADLALDAVVLAPIAVAMLGLGTWALLIFCNERVTVAPSGIKWRDALRRVRVQARRLDILGVEPKRGWSFATGGRAWVVRTKQGDFQIAPVIRDFERLRELLDSIAAENHAAGAAR
jgi:hypothetical protein